MYNPASASERPKVGALARRIHGWSWQAFPVGMGTGAVYVTMSGVKERSQVLSQVETFFYFLNMALFVLNTTTLILQAIGTSFHSLLAALTLISPKVYPRQAVRLLKDPVKGIFVPLVVRSSV